jgi:hypothetical protein
MKRKGPILPPGAAGGASFKRPFGQARKRRSGDMDDDEDDDGLSDTHATCPKPSTGYQPAP